MTYRYALSAVEENTDNWKSWLPYWTNASTNKFHAYSTTVGVDIDKLTPQTLVSIGKGVGKGFLAKDLEFNVVAVLVLPTIGGTQVQVVMNSTENAMLVNYDELSEAVALALLQETGLKQLDPPRLFLITEPDAAIFQANHGIAPLFVAENKQLVPTKAAVDPNPRQLLRGDVQALAQAIPFAPSSVTPVPPVPVPPGVDPLTGEPTLSLPAKLVLGGLCLIGAYTAACWWRENH